MQIEITDLIITTFLVCKFTVASQPLKQNVAMTWKKQKARRVPSEVASIFPVGGQGRWDDTLVLPFD